ncbi:phosphatase PAP2 family protein [Paenibacillus psychroresistens]|uniref:Phosphatase PAP2 family protein n=1 Tax=Paenibacillus psychroresistens TaxID=1778678 RepID=A0A6B8RBS5_9BACL|nr:phosphatase PAP2 family protein [Paenibacillus psychroresistens]QGQ93700.1 phosphatase PAP2 family protein [Paenibacillus psychroresistens]
MNRFIKRIVPILTMLIFPFLGMLYHWVNQPKVTVYSLMTNADNAIPFVRFFVLPYSIWIFYIYICLIYFFIKEIKVYYRTLLIYTLCALLCYFIYTFFQTTVPRPNLVGDDVFTRLTQYVYNRDLPYNCFPSIHCFSCYLVMKAIYKSSFKNRINQTLIYGMSSLIILSTLFVKQHAMMDALAGFLLVEMVYLVIARIENQLNPSLEKQRKLGEVYRG